MAPHERTSMLLYPPPFRPESTLRDDHVPENAEKLHWASSTYIFIVSKTFVTLNNEILNWNLHIIENWFLEWKYGEKIT